MNALSKRSCWPWHSEEITLNRLAHEVEALTPKLVSILRDLHRHPELGFEEQYTAAQVAGYLEAWGYNVTKGIGGTGVMGVLRGAQPGPTMALRACLDALEISECTGVAHASENPGRMHACGHDGNMTVTLGAAKILAGHHAELKGNLKFLFQPSEENTGGAIRMIEAGCLADPDVDAIITPHIWHDLPKGQLGMKAGPVMASSDLFTIEIHGVVGHGAWPHLSVDPLPVAAELILALQRIASREIDPMLPACVSLGKMTYGTAPNIIAQTVTLAGTVRTFDPALRDFIQRRIAEITDGVTRAGRATYTFDYRRVMPPLANDPALVARATGILKDALGENSVTADYAATMGCEEFSVYLDHVPGIFMLIGSHEPGTPVIEIHNPSFLFPEECLPIGVRALCAIALGVLDP